MRACPERSRRGLCVSALAQQHLYETMSSRARSEGPCVRSHRQYRLRDKNQSQLKNVARKATFHHPSLLIVAQRTGQMGHDAELYIACSLSTLAEIPRPTALDSNISGDCLAHIIVIPGEVDLSFYERSTRRRPLLTSTNAFALNPKSIGPALNAAEPDRLWSYVPSIDACPSAGFQL